MPAEDARTHLTRQWLTKASHDVHAAVLASGTGDELWDVAAFHSQQATEKALKAFLAWHDIPFRRTHNLVELLEQCAEVDTDFASFLPSAEVLTKFAIESRYPGAVSEPDAENAKDAIRRSREVVAFVLARLPEEVHP